MLPSDSEGEEGESMKEIMGEMVVQMSQVDCITRMIENDLNSLIYRMRCETVTWMTEPLMPSKKIEEWCNAHNLSQNLSIDSFMDACFEVATSIDLETRMLTFSKEDAGVLWGGRQRLSIFDLIASLPTLFN